jgi:hypothetical protein
MTEPHTPRMPLRLHVITTHPARQGQERLCIYEDDGLYRVALVAPDGLLTRLPGPPTADLDAAYTHLIVAIRARGVPSAPNTKPS